MLGVPVEQDRASILIEFIPVIAVPARDEETRLPKLIAGLAAQSWLRARGRRLHVVIVLNNCTDRSRDVLADAAFRFSNLSIETIEVAYPAACANVGTARRQALELALARGAAPQRTVLMTTDADAVPDPSWIEATLAAIGGGADLVGGQILGDRGEEARLGEGFRRRAGLIGRYAEAADRLACLVDPLPYDPWPRHRDHTGASLAVRGNVYTAVGGLPALPYREDLAFVSRARSAGYRLRHPPAVRVQVSARLDGRAPRGMAACLRDWVRAEARGEPILVEPPASVLKRAERRALLRGIGTEAEALRSAAALGIDIACMRDGAGVLMRPGALVEALAPDQPDIVGTVPVERALAEIGAMIGAFGASSLAG